MTAFLPSCLNRVLGSSVTTMAFPCSCLEGNMQEPAKLWAGVFPGQVCLPGAFLAGGTVVSILSGSALFLLLAMNPDDFGCCGEDKHRQSSGPHSEHGRAGKALQRTHGALRIYTPEWSLSWGPWKSNLPGCHGPHQLFKTCRMGRLSTER